MRTLLPIHNKAEDYKEKQLERSQTWEYAAAVKARGAILKYYPDYNERCKRGDEKILGIVRKLKAELSLPYTDELVAKMMDDLVAEFELDARLAAIEEDKRHFQNMIHILENHDDFPARWKDAGPGSLKSGLFGSIYDITPAMYEEMEKRRPGFTDRILDVIDEAADVYAAAARSKDLS